MLAVWTCTCVYILWRYLYTCMFYFTSVNGCIRDETNHVWQKVTRQGYCNATPVGHSQPNQEQVELTQVDIAPLFTVYHQGQANFVNFYKLNQFLQTR